MSGWGAAAAAIAPIVGNVAQQGMANANSRRANYRNVQNWHMANEYNSPKAQMQRLQEAGLNPNLIYGNGISGASGNAGNVSGASVAHAGNLTAGALDSYIGFKAKKAQVDLLEQQLLNAKEQQRLISNNADEAWYDAVNKNYGDPMNPIAENMRLRNEKSRLDIVSKTIDNNIKDATKAARVKEIYWKAERAEKQYEGEALRNELYRLQQEFLRIGLDRNAPWYAKLIGSIFNRYVK